MLIILGKTKVNNGKGKVIYITSIIYILGLCMWF
jgi:hypothetical protein